MTNSQSLKMYRGVGENFTRYWKAYGGWSALLSSPYLHASVILTAVCYPIFEKDWFDVVIDVTPSVLGFSLGGYAILLAFGEEKFRAIISDKGPGEAFSAFIEMNAAFIHFIVVSTIATVFAVAAKAWDLKCAAPAALGVLALCYSVACGLASAMAIFRVAWWYDVFTRLNSANPP